jgi:hypothetical protein
LLGFDRLNGAGVDAFEEDAGAVWVGFEHEAGAAGAEIGVLRDEFVTGEVEKIGDGGDFLFVDAYEARPAATVAAALAEVSGFGHGAAEVPALIERRYKFGKFFIRRRSGRR